MEQIHPKCNFIYIAHFCALHRDIWNNKFSVQNKYYIKYKKRQQGKSEKNHPLTNTSMNVAPSPHTHKHTHTNAYKHIQQLLNHYGYILNYRVYYNFNTTTAECFRWLNPWALISCRYKIISPEAPHAPWWTTHQEVKQQDGDSTFFPKVLILL